MSRFFIDDELHEREIVMRDGDTEKVYLAEMSEDQLRYRGNLILDPVSGRRNTGSNIRLDRQRMFDFKVSIKDWTFEEDGQKLPIEDKTFKRFKGYITEQIADHIRDLNALPEDIPEVKGDDGEVEQEAEENPTYAS